MSFRKNNKQERDERLNWNRFCDTNRTLIERIGLPTPVIGTRERFADFLMHGYIDHHEDWSHFNVKQLEPRQHNLLKMLIEAYLESGFEAPILQHVISLEEEKNLILKYPQNFHHRLVEAYCDLEDDED